MTGEDPSNRAGPSALIEKNGGIAVRLIARLRNRSRKKRIEIFRRHFTITPDTRLLDLGGWDGSHVNALIHGAPISRQNVFVADINEAAIASAQRRFGFTPVLINETDHRLAFPDGYFDIVFCSSVIEHVTLPKSEIWSVFDDDIFRSRSLENQAAMAQEIRRLGIQYYVQVPYRHFPIETHTWLPLLAEFHRRWQLAAIRLSNRYWIKKTQPDFYLPTEDEMKALFPDGTLLWEKSLGLRKSMIAIRTASSR